MATISVTATLQEGEQCQIVVKVGGETLHFRDSGTQETELEPRNYRSVIAGFLDPAQPGASVDVQFNQEGQILNSITIEESKFIKTLDITVA